MGMFDSFYFEDGILPDNKAPSGEEFQTKDLDCSLDKYKVDAQKNVKKFSWYGEDTDPINVTAEVYSHEFMYEGDDIMTRKYLGCKYQLYKVVIVDSKLVHVEKVVEDGYEQKD